MIDCRESIRSNLEFYISKSPYTQKEIAEKLGVSKSSITNWIKGKNSPDINLVPGLCDILGIPFTALFPSSNVPDESTDLDTEKSPSISEEDQQLLSSFHKLDEKDQYKVLGYIDSLYGAEKYSVKDTSKRA